MLRSLCLWLAVAVGGGNVTAQDILKFDFGAEKSPVAAEFTQVTAKSRYSAKAGFGFTRGGQYEYDTAKLRAPVRLGDLTRDGIVGPRVFRIDLKDGDYHVAVFTGTYTSVYVTHHLHRALTGSHWIRQGSKTLYSRPMSIRKFYGPGGPYFGSYDTFYRPGQSLWKRYLARHFPIIRLRAKANGGNLSLMFSPSFPICGMVVYPSASKAAGDALVSAFDRSRAEKFDAQFVRVPAVQDPEPFGASADELRSGMVLFSRHPMLHVYPETFPRRGEIGRSLRGFGPRGNAIHMQMGCVPTRDLGGIEVIVSDLHGPGIIPSRAIDVRYARYMAYLDRDEKHYTVRPGVLTKQRRTPADARVARAFCISVDVPESAKPGNYLGRVTVSSPESRTQVSLTMEVRVLPFKLPEPDIFVGSYYSAPTNTRFRPFYSRKGAAEEQFRLIVAKNVRAEFAMMRELGFNYVSTTAAWRPFQVDTNGKIKINEPAYGRFLLMGDAVRDAGFRRFTFFGVGWTVLLNYSPGFLNRGRAEKLPIDKIKFPESAKAPAAQTIRRLYRIANERRWPEMTFYVSDELGNMGVRGKAYGRELARFYNSLKPLVKEKSYKLLATSLRFQIAEGMLPYLDIIQPNHAWPITAETLAAARKAKIELWNYNTGANRNSYGYYLWKSGARGRTQWTFDWSCTSPDPYFGFGGGAGHCTVDPQLNCVPSSLWFIDYRGGLDDYRHVQLLEHKMRTQPTSPAVAQARKALKELSARLSLDYRAEINTWRPGTYDYFRWQLSKAIMAFR